MTTATPHLGDGESPLRPKESHSEEQSLPRRATLRTIPRLQGGYRRDAPAAVATVARLRREAGRDPHGSPSSWGLDHLATLTALRDQQREEQEEGRAAPRYLSARERAREEEREEREDRAVHLAVTLWALHQQALRDESMHKPGWPLGRAVRRLAHGKTGTTDHDRDGNVEGNSDTTARSDEAVEEVRPTIRKRFVRIGVSADIETLSSRLREIVLLLRTSRIPLDYGQLAEQLYLWQDDNHQANVRRAWGREFHRSYRKDAEPEAGEDSPTPPAGSQQNITTDDADD
ncbi:type I-E CRISPR-associated protein Cse2/CasB [Streptomyces armeniacus]|uniref:Type I-E CRISPR-associated protein Cse2/CasB n=1 Tax=Streptomyces armeniacus TaxID=83291 RepID=A0A345XVD5_9ACTN|nr:type I-E CRISPR-associated protein Cse2/CasB [Streptomyces armeniacus]AXK35601.1 type I-E CRISPR-associated protein Cse2/CasB [Streptomyces armeniacus]